MTRGEPSRKSVLLPWIIIAALSAALLAIGIAGRRQMGDTENLQRALPILEDPAAKDLVFGAAGKSSKGRVVVSESRGLVLVASNLPRLDSGKTFELWLYPGSGSPAVGGIFESQSDATAVFVRRGAVTRVESIAVTVEPEGGSPQPTTAPFVVAKP